MSVRSPAAQTKGGAMTSETANTQHHMDDRGEHGAAPAVHRNHGSELRA
jgi:hypothetical protein